MRGIKLAAQQLEALEGIFRTEATDSTLTGVQLDGTEYLACLQYDEDERNRRTSLGIGAVTSTGTLHALWATSSSPVSPTALDEPDLDTLGSLPETLVSYDHNGDLIREYHPIGEITSLCAFDDSTSRGIKKAARIPPIFERILIWIGQESEPALDDRTLTLARRTRTGIVSLCDTNVEELIQPYDRIPGVPAVYRWWLAELAYDTVLARTT